LLLLFSQKGSEKRKVEKISCFLLSRINWDLSGMQNRAKLEFYGSMCPLSRDPSVYKSTSTAFAANNMNRNWGYILLLSASQPPPPHHHLIE